MALRPDDWLQQHQSLDSYVTDVAQKVFLRNQQPRAGLQASRLDHQIIVMMTTLDKKIALLQKLLDDSLQSGLITREESLRRQRLLQQLVTKQKEMQVSLQNPSSASRDRLFGPGPSGSQRSGTGDVEAGGEAADYRQMTKQLQQEQDKGLDMLDEIINRQKGLVRGIGNQIDVQNELIDDIGGNMDTTQVRLVRNTRNVERISYKSDSCCYWVIIILLLVAIVVVSVV